MASPSTVAAPLEALLSVGQVAEICQVSDRTVRRWIADGQLPVCRLGRSVRIRPADLAAMIDRGPVK